MTENYSAKLGITLNSIYLICIVLFTVGITYNHIQLISHEHPLDYNEGGMLVITSTVAQGESPSRCAAFSRVWPHVRAASRSGRAIYFGMLRHLLLSLPQRISSKNWKLYCRSAFICGLTPLLHAHRRPKQFGFVFIPLGDHHPLGLWILQAQSLRSNNTWNTRVLYKAVFYSVSRLCGFLFVHRRIQEACCVLRSCRPSYIYRTYGFRLLHITVLFWQYFLCRQIWRKTHFLLYASCYAIERIHTDISSFICCFSGVVSKKVLLANIFERTVRAECTERKICKLFWFRRTTASAQAQLCIVLSCLLDAHHCAFFGEKWRKLFNLFFPANFSIFTCGNLRTYLENA